MTTIVRTVPEGYHTVTPRLVAKGADRLLDFLKKVFGAKEVEMLRMPDGTIGHAEVIIGDSRIILGEASPEWAMPSWTHVYVKDVDASYRIALQAGAISIKEPVDQFYGDRDAVVRDPVGNVWTLATHREDVSREEMARRIAAQTGQ